MSNSLRPHEAQQARPPCPSPTPRVHPNPCPLSPWCHPTISSSVVPFSSCPQSFPASGSFPMSQLFESGGQSTVVSASFYCAGDYRGWNNWIYLIINVYISSILKLIRKVELLYIFKSYKNYSQKVREYVCIRHLSHKCVCVLVTQSYPTLCDPMDCSPPGSSIHGILQARTLEWVAISFSNANFSSSSLVAKLSLTLETPQTAAC